MRKILAAIALTLVLCGGAAAQSPPDKAIQALDDAALGTYRGAKKEILATVDPYVIVAFTTISSMARISPR
jgi:hypothetical protein